MTTQPKGGAAAVAETEKPISAASPTTDVERTDDGDGVTSQDLLDLREALGQGPTPEGEAGGEKTEVREQKSEVSPEPKTEDGRPKTQEPAKPEAKPGEKPAEDDAETTEALTGLSPDQKAKIQRRMDRLTAKRREAEEAAQTATAQVQALTTERDSWREKAEKNPSRVERVPVDVHPLELAESDAEIDQYDAQLSQMERTLAKHWDGYTPEKEGEQSFTAEQVRERYHEVREMRERLVPKARRVLQQRQQVNAGLVKQWYPELLDAKSESARKAKALMESIPGLKAHPYALMMLGAYLEGEKALQERMKKPKEEPKPVPAAPPPPPPPDVPTASTAGRRGPSEPAKRTTGAGSTRQFIERGANVDALADAIEGLETDEEE